MAQLFLYFALSLSVVGLGGCSALAAGLLRFYILYGYDNFFLLLRRSTVSTRATSGCSTVWGTCSYVYRSCLAGEVTSSISNVCCPCRVPEPSMILLEEDFWQHFLINFIKPPLQQRTGSSGVIWPQPPPTSTLRPRILFSIIACSKPVSND